MSNDTLKTAYNIKPGMILRLKGSKFTLLCLHNDKVVVIDPRGSSLDKGHIGDADNWYIGGGFEVSYGFKTYYDLNTKYN